jgi:hypothetical protein
MAELGGGRILGTVQEVLVGNGGILGVYTGRWMLIDV